MVTDVIFFFLLAGCCFALGKRQKTAAAAMAAALVIFEAVGSGFVPLLLIENLQSRFILEDNPAWGKRNAVIVLGDGTVHFPDQPFVHGLLRRYGCTSWPRKATARAASLSVVETLPAPG
jgi:hypothetical protein